MAQKAKSLYELARLHVELGHFEIALEKIQELTPLYIELKDHRQYFKCESLCMRMRSEMEDHAAVEAIKQRIQDYIKTSGEEMSSTTLYTLAAISAQENNNERAIEYLDKALAIALKNDNKEDMCFAIYGLAVSYRAMNRIDDALKELYNLRVFFQVIKIPELELSAQILNAQILINLRKCDEALNVLWSALDDLRDHRNVYSYTWLLFMIGIAYGEAGDEDLASTHLKLAYHMCDPKCWVFLQRKITEQMQRLTGKAEVNFDLVFNSVANSVFERKKGKIDFKNQFILMDMLKLFLKHPGEVYSKEALVKAVWKQEYDPRVHDNKIYVTIKRLRQLIEPDFDKPKYIYRAKNGYYLNRNAKVSIEQ
jgi:DNA-binding winged helix-turn-helix (wHTH) protein